MTQQRRKDTPAFPAVTGDLSKTYHTGLTKRE